MPFVTAPFGMTNWTPQTRQNKISVTSYNYDDRRSLDLSALISRRSGWETTAMSRSFRRLANCAPRQNHGSFRTVTHQKQRSRTITVFRLIRARGEEIQAEMTATERCAMFPIHLSERTARRALSSRLRGRGLLGWQRSILKRGRSQATTRIAWMPPGTTRACPTSRATSSFNSNRRRRDMKTYGSEDAKLIEPRSIRGIHPRAKPCRLRVGTSFISVEQARENLKREIPDWDFEAAQRRLRAQWNQKLSQLQIGGADGYGQDADLHGDVSRAALPAHLL